MGNADMSTRRGYLFFACTADRSMDQPYNPAQF